MINSDLRTLEPVSYESSSMVPIGYAEKAMASLMQLHSELMDEKERRVDLYRRLMDKEQVVAELRMYVQLLEEKLAAKEEAWSGSRASVSRPVASRPVSAPAEVSIDPQNSPSASAQSPGAPHSRPSPNPRPYRANAFEGAANLNPTSRSGAAEGWRTW